MLELPEFCRAHTLPSSDTWLLAGRSTLRARPRCCNKCVQCRWHQWGGQHTLPTNDTWLLAGQHARRCEATVLRR